MKTGRQAEGHSKGDMLGTARLVTTEMARGSQIAGVLRVWEVWEGEESRMTPWGLGGWKLPFTRPEKPTEEQ